MNRFNVKQRVIRYHRIEWNNFFFLSLSSLSMSMKWKWTLALLLLASAIHFILETKRNTLKNVCYAQSNYIISNIFHQPKHMTCVYLTAARVTRVLLHGFRAILIQIAQKKKKIVLWMDGFIKHKSQECILQNKINIVCNWLMEFDMMFNYKKKST